MQTYVNARGFQYSCSTSNLQLFFSGLLAPGIRRQHHSCHWCWTTQMLHPAWRDPWLIEFLLNLKHLHFLLENSWSQSTNYPFAHLKTIINIPFSHKHTKKCLTNEKKCLALPIIKEIQIKTTKCNFCLSIW